MTAGRRLPGRDVARLADALSEMQPQNPGLCASTGMLERQDLEALRSSGVTRYHHILETARSHFGTICTTHTYDQKLDTIDAARSAGLSLCVGGLFGIGETDEQVLEFALALREINPEAVPVNFLVPIPGTPAYGRGNLTPLRCLKIISLLRFVLPRQDILICGGREQNLRRCHSLIFLAGASGIMTGDYLTTAGRRLDEDMDMIRELGYGPRMNVQP